jgi:hypothetical protein
VRAGAAPAARPPFTNARIAAIFDAYPAPIRRKLMRLRALIFETAKDTEGVGELEEALRWGEPSYLTSKTKSGSMIRLDSKKPGTFALFFHCQTDLVPTFRELYPETFTFEGKRALVLDVKKKLPERELRHCITLALTYHLEKVRR